MAFSQEPADYETVTRPLVVGDLVVIDIGGKLVPKRPNDPRPQWFLVLQDQSGATYVRLKPFDKESKLLKPKRYIASEFRF